MTRKTIAQAMAAVNNLVTSLLAFHAFRNFAQATRTFDAQPQKALALSTDLKKAVLKLWLYLTTG